MTSTLLHFDGVNGSANFFDEVSQTDLPINGTPNVSSVRSKFGGSSGHFTNDGQILVAASQFVAGNDWCIEGFIFTESGTDGSSIANVQNTTNAFNMFHDSNVSCRLLIGGSNAISGIVTPSDEWFHLAIVKNGTTITVYMNGVSAGTTSVASTYVPPADIYIAGHPSVGSHAFNGYIDEFRVTNDDAVYLSDFTPPVHAFHLNEISARYWRLVNITLPSGASHLEVSQIEFYDNNEVSTNAGVTVTSSNVPTEPIGNLTDSNLNSRCYWTAAIAQDEDFYIQYDFGADQTVTKMRQAGFDTSTRFIESCTVQYSDDGIVWVDAAVLTGNTYPGNNTFSPYYILNPLPVIPAPVGASVYSRAIIAANPVAYWRMNDTDSNMVDTMGKHNGTHVNRTLGTVGGIVGDDALSSRYISANTEGSQVPVHPDFQTPNFSFEFWIKYDVNTLSQYQYMLSQQDNGLANGHRFAFTMGNSTGNEDALRFWLNNGTWNGVDIDLPFVQDIWYHLAVAYDDTLGEAKIYVNGVHVQSLAVAGLTVPTVPLTIASLYSNSAVGLFPLDGNMQELAFYDRVITELEVKQHWFIGRKYGDNYEYEVLKSDPVSYWRMDDPSGNDYVRDEMAQRELVATGNPISGVAGLIGEGTCYDLNSTYANGTHSYDFTDDELSIEAWVEFDTLGTRNYVLTREDNTATGWMQAGLEIASDGRARLLIQRASTNTFFHFETAAGVITTGTTYHIVTTWNKNAFDSTDCSIYVNGVSIPVTLTVGGGTYNASFTLPTLNSLVEIGRRGFEPGNLLDARVDQVALYNRAISQSEVTLHYNAGTGTIPANETYNDMIASHGAIHHWTIDDPYTTPTDQIGNNNATVGKGTPVEGNIISPNIGRAVGLTNVRYNINTPPAVGNTWSVEVWLKCANTGYQTILTEGDSRGCYIRDNLPSFFEGGDQNSATNIANRAVQIVWTYDGTSGRMYIDGKLDSTFANAPATFTPDIFAGGNGTFDVQGDFQSLSINDGVLTDRQIMEHFLRGVNEGTFATYSIAGNAKIDGVNQPCVIRAYRADNGELAATIVADGVTGDYVLDNLEDGTEYYVMCIPPSGQSTVCPQANGAFLPATDGNATVV